MKKMKKMLALAISAVLILSLSVCYFAADREDGYKNNVGTINLDSLSVTGGGIEVQENTIIISKGGDFTVTGSLDDGMIRINTDGKVKLRLSGMSLTNTQGPAIYFENAEKGFITITEDTENYIKDGGNYSAEDADAALFSNDDLEIKGAGTLTIEGNYKHGIASDDDLSIENGTIIITSAEHGIKANDKVTISGGNIDITAKTGKGIKAGEELVIDGGAINIVSLESEGLESKGTITINGGDINIEAADDGINTGTENSQNTADEFQNRKKSSNSENEQTPQNQELTQGGQKRERIKGDMPNADFQNGEPPQRPDFDGKTPPEMKKEQKTDGSREMRQPPQDGEMMQPPQGDMPDIERHQGDMNFGGFGKVDDETAALHAITINGGNIYIKTSGDGIDSNGSLTITGGTIKIDGPEMNGNGPLDSDGTMAITGGEIITLSSAGMLQLPQSSDIQNTLKVVFGEQGTQDDKISVKDSDGNEIMSTISKGKYMALIYSSDKLKEGDEYRIYVNDNLQETVTLTKGITSVGNNTEFTGGFGGRGTRENEVSDKYEINGKIL